MELRQLRYFVTIVEQGSLSKASVVLNIAQPALSTHVRNMEFELGTTLLFRSAQGVKPTAAGETLLRHSRVVMGQIETARREIADQEAVPSGEVRLGLPGTIGQMVSVPLILEVQRHFPKVKLCIVEAMSGFVLEWVQEGRVDLAMLYMGVEGRELQSTPILTEELRLFCANSHVGERPAGLMASYEDISRLPLVLPSASHGLRQLLEAESAAHGVPLGTIIEVDAYNSIRELVETGMGFAILPRVAIIGKTHEDKFISWRIGEPPLSRTVHLVRPSERSLGNAVAAVERLCRATLVDLVRTGRWASSQLVTPE
jgi:LysR family transcriptional regulator, nitrogen assimilation regulatory protein